MSTHSLGRIAKRYARWPARVRVPTIMSASLRWLLTERDFLTIPIKARFVVEPLKLDAREWLGVHPRPELEECYPCSG